MSARPLVFDEAGHTYRVDGQRLPSVTQVLKPLSAYAEAIPAEVLARKARIGQAAHRSVELYNEQRLDPASVHETVRPYFEAYRLFMLQYACTPIAGELRVWHPAHRYAGTLDLLAVLGDKPALIDIKCTLAIMPTTGPQVAAYQEAAANTPELPDEQRAIAREAQRWCLQLKADGTFDLSPLSDPADWRVFLACLSIHYFKTKHEQHYRKQ